ncbi:hypothetical protein Fcan01_11233 [Folsomia candida]|uniref:Uncharacterized protein n=1 Tax=Folsomia candida TaxID=158441 RepID=A0A226E7Z6_FOLCA|nr:hypothetical protein Fcan01_11233 [Folsomia candida]
MSTLEIIRLVNPVTGVLLRDDGMDPDVNDAISELLCGYYWDDEDALGPDCHLCGQSSVDESLEGEANNWNIKEEDRWKIGTLQCSYCFNFFHKNRFDCGSGLWVDFIPRAACSFFGIATISDFSAKGFPDVGTRRDDCVATFWLTSIAIEGAGNTSKG